MKSGAPDNNLPNRKHPAHHPTVERHNQPVIIHLTVCTDQRRPILASEQVHAALTDVWKSSNHWKVGRYVIMPDHIHLFCSPVGKEHENVAKWVTYWKRSISRSLPELQPIWQRDCWDTQLRQHESYTEKWHYIRNNPVRKGLAAQPDDWPFQGELNVLMW
ncbi:transposase [Pontiellaceae bacterium B12227]|nr:transposase [Pontiellaceae bacterium B12227]